MKLKLVYILANRTKLSSEKGKFCCASIRASFLEITQGKNTLKRCIRVLSLWRQCGETHQILTF